MLRNALKRWRVESKGVDVRVWTLKIVGIVTDYPVYMYHPILNVGGSITRQIVILVHTARDR